MKPIVKALISTIAYVCIVAAGFLLIIGLVKFIDWLLRNGYGVHAGIGFIIIIFFFNYFKARKQQTGPQ